MTGNPRHDYVERLATALADIGLPRMAARVMAALMIADPPGMSTSELMEALDASKASVSTSTSLLTNVNLVQRFHVRGSREAHYRVVPGLWADVLRQKTRAMGILRASAEEGLAIGDLSPEARERLEEMRDTYAFIEGEIESMLRRWQETRRG